MNITNKAYKLVHFFGCQYHSLSTRAIPFQPSYYNYTYNPGEWHEDTEGEGFFVMNCLQTAEAYRKQLEQHYPKIRGQLQVWEVETVLYRWPNFKIHGHCVPGTILTDMVRLVKQVKTIRATLKLKEKQPEYVI